MFKNLRRAIGGDQVGRELERCAGGVAAINALEPELRNFSDDALRRKTEEFRRRLAEGESLDDVLVEAFAAVREASMRMIGLRPFDVQLAGGILLHEGKSAEMRTGEGKTLVATLPMYLNALEGQGVHLVTVNDYLARRDARWMGPIFESLGLSVGVLQEAARPPLIISGPSHEDPEMYERVARGVRELVPEDYEVSERDRSVALTELGEEHIERLLGARLRDPDRPEDITPEQARLLGFVEQALRAEHLFKRNKDYVVQAGRGLLLHEFTRR